jgi:serine/threonine protein kinase
MFRNTTEVTESLSSSEIDHNKIYFGREIGKGGFGQVYLCRYQGIEIAVKRAISNSNVNEIKNERIFTDILSLSPSPNIVKFYKHKSETVNFNVQIAMEYLPQGSLLDFLKSNDRPFIWDDRFRVVKGIANGINFLHGLGIMHCDLKPGNILLTENLQPKISDFNEAINFSRAYCSRTIWGSPDYQAPEASVLPQSDIYSFGVILEDVFGHRRSVIPTELFNFIQRCKDPIPSNRPSAEDCVVEINRLESISSLSLTNDIPELCLASSERQWVNIVTYLQARNNIHPISPDSLLPLLTQAIDKGKIKAIEFLIKTLDVPVNFEQIERAFSKNSRPMIEVLAEHISRLSSDSLSSLVARAIEKSKIIAIEFLIKTFHVAVTFEQIKRAFSLNCRPLIRAVAEANTIVGDADRSRLWRLAYNSRNAEIASDVLNSACIFDPHHEILWEINWFMEADRVFLLDYLNRLHHKPSAEILSNLLYQMLAAAFNLGLGFDKEKDVFTQLVNMGAVIQERHLSATYNTPQLFDYVLKANPNIQSEKLLLQAASNQDWTTVRIYLKNRLVSPSIIAKLSYQQGFFIDKFLIIFNKTMIDYRTNTHAKNQAITSVLQTVQALMNENFEAIKNVDAAAILLGCIAQAENEVMAYHRKKILGWTSTPILVKKLSAVRQEFFSYVKSEGFNYEYLEEDFIDRYITYSNGLKENRTFVSEVEHTKNKA